MYLKVFTLESLLTIGALVLLLQESATACGRPVQYIDENGSLIETERRPAGEAWPGVRVPPRRPRPPTRAGSVPSDLTGTGDVKESELTEYGKAYLKLNQNNVNGGGTKTRRSVPHRLRRSNVQAKPIICD